MEPDIAAHLKSRTLVALVVTIVAACGGTTAPLAAVDRAFSADERGACEALTRAIYRHWTHDCPLIGNRIPDDADEETYVARRTPACELGYFTIGSRVTPDVLRACANAIPSTACSLSQHVGALDVLQVTPACDFPSGDLADGSACSNDLQCAGGDCGIVVATHSKEVLLNLEACGTCKRAAGVGEPCGPNIANCATTLFCVSGRCAARFAVPRGGACSDNAECSGGLVCGSQSPRACTDPDPAGAPCFDGTCRDGLFCGAITPMSNKYSCRPLVGAGGDCDGSTCAAGYHCNGFFACQSVSEWRTPSGTWLEPGDPCTVSGGISIGYYSSCIPPTACIEDRCVYFDSQWCTTDPGKNVIHPSAAR